MIFNKKQTEGIETLFGKPMLDHKLVIFVPKKINKVETRGFCEILFSKLVSLFGACTTQDLSVSYLNNGKEVRDDQYQLTVYFGERHLKYLKDVKDWCLGFMLVMGVKGVQVEIDNNLFWVNQ